jgi:hypothetical protein
LASFVVVAALVVVAAFLALGTHMPRRDPSSFPFALFLGLPVVAWLAFASLNAAARQVARSLRSSRKVDVGTDGVLVGRRLIPYSAITAIAHERRSVSEWTLNGTKTSYEWVVSLVVGGVCSKGTVLGGEKVQIVTQVRGVDAAPEDQLGAELTRAIRDGLATWRRWGDEGLLEADLSRGDRTGAEWVEALRNLGSGDSISYRAAARDIEGLSQLLDDPAVKPSARAAAAVALTASGDATAKAKLRVAAEAVVDPQVRVALESVAEERAVAEALEVLDDAETEQMKRRAAPG